MRTTLVLCLAGWMVADLSAASNRVGRSAIRLDSPSAVLARTNLTLVTNPSRPDTVLLRVDPAVFNTARLTTVTRDQGGSLPTTNQVLRSTDGFELTLPRNKQVVVFSRTNAPRGRLETKKTQFPGTLMVRGNGDEVRSGELFLLPRESPLPWDSGTKSYQTMLVVGLDMVEADTSVVLDPPVTVQFFARNARIEPDSVVVTNSGSSGYREVQLTCTRSSVEPQVTAVCDLGDLTQGIPLETLSLLAVVESVLPLRFLIVSLAGGAVGGLLRRNSRRNSPQRASWIAAAVQGSLVALVVVSSLTAGLSLALGLVNVVGAEVGAFAVACLSGFGGIVLLERLVKKTFGTESTETHSTPNRT